MIEQLDSHAALLSLFEEGQCPHAYILEQRFPHILQRISALMGKPELDDYLHGLLGPLRPGVSGFPDDALAAIVGIKAYCRRHGFSGDRGSEVREAFLSWLNFDQRLYPYSLEADFPELLAAMLPLLGKPALGEQIDMLLAPAKQLHHRFSEAALIELMTIKAVLHTRLAADRQQGQAANDDHHAALVLERYRRR